MGAGGSPCGVARRGGACAVGPSLATPQGLPTAPKGGAAGGLSASYLSVGFLLSDSSY